MVCALNFPVSANPGLARVIGTLMKQDFQRAVLNRSPDGTGARPPLQEVLFLCDEYHSFATAGESDPAGNSSPSPVRPSASLSSPRKASVHCDPHFRENHGELWHQTFRTKIFLTLSDDFSARTASRLCGRRAIESQLHAV